MNKSIYNPFNAMEFDHEHCFLCGIVLGESNKSEEHIFPKWLQHKYDLWNQKLVLRNGAKVQYKSLKIPCCKTCNNENLKGIEDKIKESVEMGYNEFRKIDEEILFLWISKIYYGIMFKELMYRKDIKDPNSEMIIKPRDLKRFESLHILLQSSRFKINFHGDKPWSIFIFNMQHLNNKYDFDFHDIYEVAVISIRIGDTGIVACLGDDGYVKDILAKKYQVLEGQLLHPMQLTEVFAEFAYTAINLNWTPYYCFVRNNKEEEFSIITNNYIDRYEEPNNDYLFAKILAKYLKKWGYDFDSLYNVELNSCSTFLNNERGEFYFMNYKEHFEHLNKIYKLVK